MVREQLAERGIGDPAVLAAMGRVPRERFVRHEDRGRAYADMALGLEQGQTISQPWIVARIAEALELTGGERVLEVGTGSGYSAAVMACLAGEVISIERLPSLAATARERLRALGFDNVEVRTADGSLGLPAAAPFDAIAVHAASPAAPPQLLDQLTPGGRLVVPVAEGDAERLTLYRRAPDGAHRAGPLFSVETLGACRFVPLIGEHGYPERGD